ncbi:MAG: tRNA (adenosine(37)-N6)-dimethylallyltransferase MiaA [Proteobacteria bacterium SW_6_67_9]|nr:MAG: tRNA (adenosine(37)-N6)-dimethylallyltransferase MiaA [Proteobacteria bacterium SW_6_67_9]
MSHAASSPPAVFLMGPTAAGKTEVALHLARRLPVELISVDSAQVYRGLDIGTAKPDPATRARLPHHLIDVAEPEEAYSAGRFRGDAVAAMASVRARGRVPLLVGGTMLYFRALAQGLGPMPPADTRVRQQLEREAGERGLTDLHAELARVDPAAGQRIHPHDGQRIQRALEVWRIAGEPISAYQGRETGGVPDTVLRLAVAPPSRARLHERIAARFDAMLAQGLVAETRTLLDRPGIDGDGPALRAVGYRQAVAHLQGQLDTDGLRERGIIATRQLAKRQLTWLRGMSDVVWYAEEPLPVAAIEARVRRFLAG